MRPLLPALFWGSLAARLLLLLLAPKAKGLPPLLGLLLGAFLFTSLSVLAAFSGGALGALLGLGKRLLWFALGVVGCVASNFFECGIAAEISLLVAGTGLALLVLPLLRERNILVPVALVAAMVDLWGVAAGPTAVAMRSSPEVVQRASVKVSPLGGMRPISFMGLGDLVFVALFGGAVSALGLRLWATLCWMVVLLLFAMWLAIFLPVPVPALPFVSLAVLLPNRRSFSLSKGEKLAASAVAAIIAALLAIISIVGAR